jgi:hypothetical protein
MRTRVKTTGGNLEAMTSPLSTIPIEKRRRLAATLGLFAVLLIAIGAVAATGRGSDATPVFSIIALVIAVLVGLIAWGVTRSIQLDLGEQKLDAAIEATLAGRPEFANLCSCGHDHDPNELHITDAEEHTHDATCSHDGGGTACAHDCSSCVLAAMRPSPNRTRQDRLV